MRHLTVGQHALLETALEQRLSQFDRRLSEHVGAAPALTRLHHTGTGAYGLCAECGTEIPFGRLKLEPWARRCVPCQTQREQATSL